MYTSQSNHYGIGYITSNTKRGLELCHLLSDKLPHGSGINYNWQLEYKRGKIHAYNSFEAMNENGFYCHDYPFHAIFQHNDVELSMCKCCAGLGVNSSLLICSVCSGTGQVWANEFTLLRVMFYGNKERSCCGLGLFDYIDNTLCLA